MGQLRRNPINGQWVIVGGDSGSKSPEEFEGEKPVRDEKKNCPFCPGNESKTPLEILAYRSDGTGSWLTRVVPNLFPALQTEGELGKSGVGVYDRMNGVGAHEVVIEHSDHEKQLADLTDQDLEKVVWTYRDRIVDLARDKRFKYLLIFKNYGFSAGASLEHSHSQLIALPIVPKSVKEEIKGAEEYLEYRDRCVFCDMILQERREGLRLLDENKYFMSFCPFFSRFPFEVWIMPREHQADFGSIRKEESGSFAQLIRATLARMKKRLRDPSYNFMLHTVPLDGSGTDAYHWHLEIIPKLAQIAGFEWGTGFYINPTPPEDAVRWLKEVTV
ncbi:MAG: galactose-1-phosphate uridylyltransferase [Candidatus Omnitrophica bacterium]|nr:galactose-1-phosphate uridylyltransferase [Candidatus Omnitrophota bacterium]